MAVRTYKDSKGRTRYLVEFQQGGKRVCRRCYAGMSRSKAVEYETKLRGEAFDQTELGKKPEITLQDAITRWLRDTLGHKKDQKKPEQNAKLLEPFVKGRMLDEVTEAARAASKAWATKTPATINQRLCILKAAVKHAYKQGWVGENLSGRITLLPLDNKREVYLTPNEVKTLAGKAPSRATKAAIMVAAYTGMRAGELLAAEAEKDAPTIRAQSKNGPVRHIPVAGVLRPYLRYLPLGMTYDQLRREFVVARVAAKMEHVRWHDLRHTFASMLINQGVDLYTVGKLLGHTAPITTARYAHLSQATLKKAVATLR